MDTVPITKQGKEASDYTLYMQGVTPDGKCRLPIHWAALDGCAETIRNLIKAGSPVNVADKEGCHPLHYAAGRDCTEGVKALIKAGCDIEAKDKDGRTALFFSAVKGCTDAARVLVEAGAAICARSNTGLMPIHWAAKRGHVAFIHTLVNYGAPVILADGDGLHPLHHAADQGHAEAVEALIKTGCDVDAMTHSKETALYLALDNCMVERAEYMPMEMDRFFRCVRALAEAGTALSTRTDSHQLPIHEAARGGCVENIRVLLEFGSPVSVADGDGWHPLHHAVLHGRVAVVEELLRFLHEADDSNCLARQKIMEDALALCVFCTSAQNGMTIARHMLSLGYSLPCAHRALAEKCFGAKQRHPDDGRAEVLELLLDAGCDVGALAESEARPIALPKKLKYRGAFVDLLMANGVRGE